MHAQEVAPIDPLPILGMADQDYPDAPVKPIELYPMCAPEKLDGSRICYSAVINGARAFARDAPWQAQIFRTYPASAYAPATLRRFKLWELNHVCGGSLIDDAWIVTAAHCVMGPNFDVKNTAVRLGATDISVNDGRVFAIKRVITHSRYDPRTQLNDIALIEIDSRESFPRNRNAIISVIPLHGAHAIGPRLLPWQNFVVSGWGVTSVGPDARPSPVLMRLTFERVPNPLCAQTLNAPDKINDSVICAIAPAGDACQGDSGGPLTVATGATDSPAAAFESVLVGVVSWGRGCAISGNPGVYTRISAHLPWIRQAMASPATVRALP